MEISDDVHAVDAWQILRGEVNPGSKVVIAQGHKQNTTLEEEIRDLGIE